MLRDPVIRCQRQNLATRAQNPRTLSRARSLFPITPSVNGRPPERNWERVGVWQRRVVGEVRSVMLTPDAHGYPTFSLLYRPVQLALRRFATHLQATLGARILLCSYSLQLNKQQQVLRLKCLRECLMLQESS